MSFFPTVICAATLLFMHIIDQFPSIQESKDLSVMSFNIRMSNGKDGINIWENRKALVLKTLKKRDVAVIGMQEVTSKQYLFLKEKLTGYTAYGVGRKDGNLEDEITAIFYKNKFEVLQDSTIWLSENPKEIGSKSWDASLYRTVSWVILKNPDNGDEYAVYNTHFDHRGVRSREESAKIIMKLIASTSNGLPTVLMGDFNVTELDSPYTIITSEWKDYYQLQNARLISELPHQGGNVTFNGFKDEYGKIIDFVFVNHGFRVKSHQFLNIKEGDIFISDHYPVEVHLQIVNDKVNPNANGKTMD